MSRLTTADHSGRHDDKFRGHQPNLDLASVLPAAARSRAENRDDGQITAGLAHIEELPARPARYGDWPLWVHPQLVAAYQNRGVYRPWSHQAAAAEAIWNGTHTIVATGTASGKTLSYALPVLSRILSRRRPSGRRGATALYIAPTKALAQDQLTRLKALAHSADQQLWVATHDGDTSPDERRWNRDEAELLLTNPDMLHHSLLAQHERWSQFWRQLEYVIIDECHYYRGLFGAHVAHILRRLRRIAVHHRRDLAPPTFVLASATTAEPAQVGEALTGVPMAAFTEDGSPRGPITIALWQPEGLGTAGLAAPYSDVAEMLAQLVTADVPSLAFIRSRYYVEKTALATQQLLEAVDPTRTHLIASYRGGYLPQERRELEAAFRSGHLRALTATNALELGIDIPELAAVVMAGYPGTRAAFWQQLGRAGRRGEPALGVMVANSNPLDQYLLRHPTTLLAAPVEATVFDVNNPYVLGPHLCAAAAELPLTEPDLATFGPRAPAVVAELCDMKLLRSRPRGWFWTHATSPASLANLRGGGHGEVILMDAATAQVIGSVERDAATSRAFPGAIYIHRGEYYRVLELDLTAQVATVEPVNPTYETRPGGNTSIEVIDSHRSHRWGRAQVSLGEVIVTHTTTSYQKIDLNTGKVLQTVDVELPPQQLTTTAVWWTLSAEQVTELELSSKAFNGAIHAAEHAAIGLLPLFATCDRADLGGVSTPLHPDTGAATVFVYDGHAGGAGFAERGYTQLQPWLAATRTTIAQCRCRSGCPGCVHSPQCGNYNNPLHKEGAVAVLATLLAGAPPV